MKRKRLILTTVLLACVAAVVVPQWREIWLAVAYESKPEQGQRGESGWGMHHVEKRFSWGPGEAEFIPSQRCGFCRNEVHDGCKQQFIVVGTDVLLPRRYSRKKRTSRHLSTLIRQQQEKGEDIALWHCTCPDPSHEWNQ